MDLDAGVLYYIMYSSAMKDLNAIQKEILRLIMNAEPPELASVVIGLAWRAGLTRHEIWMLTWDDVDCEVAVMRVQGREVPIEPELTDLLTRWRDVTAKIAREPFVVILKSKGTRPTENSLSQKAKEALDGKGLRGVRLIDLRSDYVHRAFECNDASQAMRMTGVALSTYRHLYKKESNAEIAPPRYTEQEASNRLWDVLQHNREGCVGIALWLTQMVGLTEQEAVDLTWDQYDGKRGVLSLKRGSFMLTTELISILDKEYSKRTEADDAHILLSRRKRAPMSVSQLSETLRQVLIREGLDDHTVSAFRRNSRAESQRNRIRDETERKGRITGTAVQQMLGVSSKVASARLSELVESGELVKAGRSYIPAGQGTTGGDWQELVMDLINRRGEVRIVEVAYQLHISKSTARRYLLQLADKGELVYEREKRRFRLAAEA